MRLDREVGVGGELGRRVGEWSATWHRVIADMGATDTDDLDVLISARDEALKQTDPHEKLIPRDDNGSPTFRAQYAAHWLMAENHHHTHPNFQQLIPTGPHGMRPHFDRLDAIVDKLIAERKAERFPYHLDEAQLPQAPQNMPPSLERGGVEHAMFLMNTCYYMRGGIKSVAAFRSLSALYEQQPDLFDAHRAQSMSPDFVQGHLAAFGLNYKSAEVSKSWIENSRRMVETYDGDPRKIFRGDIDYDELLSRIRNQDGRGFIGFQKKMASMLSYYLMSDGLVPYRDYPLPVDFHVLRVSAANGIVTFDRPAENGNILSDDVLDMLREMYRDYSVTHNVSQLDVCDAVWSLSAAVCGKQPGNIWLEPDKANGRSGRSTLIHPLKIDLNDPRQQRMYRDSCGLCPLEETCQTNYPSKPYYVAGEMRGSPRIRFPKDTLF